MRGSMLGLLAAALFAGVAGCSLPEVLPLEGGTTSGPSPYGPWYEQHWATNAVLLAAADQPDVDLEIEVDADAEIEAEAAAIDAALAEGVAEAEAAEAASGEPIAAAGAEAAEFSNSTPYQFPSSSFAPPPAAPAAPAAPADDLAPPASASPGKTTAPADGAPIRY